MNAFGNGLVVPFLLIYLHNERGIGLGVAGLILATNAGVSLISGPIGGILVDRVGGKTMLTAALGFLAIGFRRLRVRREPVAGFPRQRHHGHRQRPLLARAVDPARRADDAGAALGHVRDAARGDEPRHRPRRRRRRLHRVGELPGALRARRAHVRRLRRGADRLRPRPRSPAGAARTLGQLPDGLPAQGLHGADGRQLALHRSRHRAARDPARVRQERGRRLRARDRLALLHQHDRDRAAAAADDAARRRAAAHAAAGAGRRRLRGGLAARARERALADGR